MTYDNDEAQRVLEQARKDYNSILSAPADAADARRMAMLAATLAGEVLEVAVATLERVEEIHEDIQDLSGARRLQRVTHEAEGGSE